MIDNNNDPGKSNFFDKLFSSMTDALKVENLLKRLVYGFVFGFVLGLRYVIGFIDSNFKMVKEVLLGKWYYYLLYFFISIGQATWKGIQVALASIWQVIFYNKVYISNNSLGSVIFTVFIILLLISFFYQPVSILLNIFDLKVGQAWGVLVKIVITVVVVLGLSAWVYYSGTGDVIVSSVSNSSVVNNVTSNVSISVDNLINSSSTIISLL